jgi:hypothetical protein
MCARSGYGGIDVFGVAGPDHHDHIPKRDGWKRPSSLGDSWHDMDDDDLEKSDPARLLGRGERERGKGNKSSMTSWGTGCFRPPVIIPLSRFIDLFPLLFVLPRFPFSFSAFSVEWDRKHRNHLSWGDWDVLVTW